GRRMGRRRRRGPGGGRGRGGGPDRAGADARLPERDPCPPRLRGPGRRRAVPHGAGGCRGGPPAPGRAAHRLTRTRPRGIGLTVSRPVPAGPRGVTAGADTGADRPAFTRTWRST